MFFPRTGPGYRIMGQGRDGLVLARSQCCVHPRQAGQGSGSEEVPGCAGGVEYKLGLDIGLTGTPGMVLESGELIPGYMEPTDLLKHIMKKAASRAKPPGGHFEPRRD